MKEKFVKSNLGRASLVFPIVALLIALMFFSGYIVPKFQVEWGIYSSQELTQMTAPISKLLREMNIDSAGCAEGRVSIKINDEVFFDSVEPEKMFSKSSPCSGLLHLAVSQKDGAYISGRKYNMRKADIEAMFKSVEKIRRQQEFDEMAERIKLAYSNIGADRTRNKNRAAERLALRQQVAATWQEPSK